MHCERILSLLMLNFIMYYLCVNEISFRHLFSKLIQIECTFSHYVKSNESRKKFSQKEKYTYENTVYYTLIRPFDIVMSIMNK